MECANLSKFIDFRENIEKINIMTTEVWVYGRVFVFYYQKQKGYDELRKLCRQGSEFCKEIANILNERYVWLQKIDNYACFCM
jgi:hypothetical protein